MDGQQANFLAGGEFPVPVMQSGGTGGGMGITIVWKEYGIRLNFKPTIVDEDHIRLELEPEVSTIDYTNGIKFNGFVVPALRTRRAKTGVELRDGQSFALAGLLDNSETKSLSRIPIISDIPVIGNLFKSKSFQKNETELMFIVTANIVRPVNRDDLPQMKGMDGLKKGSPLGLEPKGEGIEGRTGFKVSGQNSDEPTQPVEPAKVAEPKASDPKAKSTTDSASEKTGSGSISSTRNINLPLPVARELKFDLSMERAKQ